MLGNPPKTFQVGTISHVERSPAAAGSLEDVASKQGRDIKGVKEGEFASPQTVSVLELGGRKFPRGEEKHFIPFSQRSRSSCQRP